MMTIPLTYPTLPAQVEWKYIVIDEAQRMKDRESKLAKDLERFITSRRLLLTGAPRPPPCPTLSPKWASPAAPREPRPGRLRALWSAA